MAGAACAVKALKTVMRDFPHRGNGAEDRWRWRMADGDGGWRLTASVAFGISARIRATWMSRPGDGMPADGALSGGESAAGIAWPIGHAHAQPTLLQPHEASLKYSTHGTLHIYISASPDRFSFFSS